MSCKDPTTEVVRGRPEAAQTDELLAFWSSRGGPTADDARRRLSEVVCVLRCDGARAGMSSVHAADVARIGGRRFWIYSSALVEDAAEQAAALLRSTFNALEAEFDGSRGSPIGLCVLLDDASERRRRPEVEWSDPRMIYAGYLGDGRQIRIAYFENAEITREQAYG